MAALDEAFVQDCTSLGCIPREPVSTECGPATKQHRNFDLFGLVFLIRERATKIAACPPRKRWQSHKTAAATNYIAPNRCPPRVGARKGYAKAANSPFRSGVFHERGQCRA